jgi:hypothetical protein
MFNLPVLPPVQRKQWCCWALWICLPWMGLAATDAKPVDAKPVLSLEQKGITPDGLTRFFADFTYELAERVQSPETFLSRKRGDCDDFSRLVSAVLERHGYRTKLVVVLMEQQTHVVCYVEERRGYLDYNFRMADKPVIASDGTLEDIAQKVAESFRSNWHMASAIRYEGDRPVFVDTAFAPKRSKQPLVTDKALPDSIVVAAEPVVIAAEVTIEPAVETIEKGESDAAVSKIVPESSPKDPRG